MHTQSVESTVLLTCSTELSPQKSLNTHIFLTLQPYSPLAQTDMYFVTFGSCNPTQLSPLFSLVDTYYPTVLLADTVCTHSHALLLLVQLTKLVTTAHEQCAMTRGSCWKHNFCQFERGVLCDINDDDVDCGVV